ncbi:MAG: hypothetical protein AAF899_01635 [Pseudomonadota bacterium]
MPSTPAIVFACYMAAFLVAILPFTMALVSGTDTVEVTRDSGDQGGIDVETALAAEADG